MLPMLPIFSRGTTSFPASQSSSPSNFQSPICSMSFGLVTDMRYHSFHIITIIMTTPHRASSSSSSSSPYPLTRSHSHSSNYQRDARSTIPPRVPPARAATSPGAATTTPQQEECAATLSARPTRSPSRSDGRYPNRTLSHPSPVGRFGQHRPLSRRTRSCLSTLGAQ